MQNEFQKIKQECENYDLSTKSDQEIENFKDKCLERIIAIWEDVKKEYMKFMESCYTNWNSGRTKDGKEQTYDFSFNKTQTVANSNMEALIDRSLLTGEFTELDDICQNYKRYLSTCRSQWTQWSPV